MQTLEEFVGGLGGNSYQLSDGSWMVSCPVPSHGKGRGDQNPSLHLSTQDDGKLLWKCHGGCTSSEVQAALGISGAWREGPGGGPSLSGGTPGGSGFSPRPPAPPALPEAQADLRGRVYQALLDGLHLHMDHLGDLKRRGLSDGQIDALGYKSVEGLSGADLSILVNQLRARFGEAIHAVPGFKDKGRHTELAATAGMLIPFRDAAGRITGIQLRNAAGKQRYAWLGQGVSAADTPHVPLACGPLPKETVRITEGGLKADVVMALSGEGAVPTVGVAGAGLWKVALPLLAAWNTRTVRLAFDQDKAGRDQRKRATAFFSGKGYAVEVEEWDGEAAKGLDDALAAGVYTGVGKPFAGVRWVASEVEEKPIDWLWEGWVPRGCYTVLDGDPGVAKSTFLYWLAAQVTLGNPEVGGGEPGVVLVFNAEDDMARVMRPRLRLSGADLSRVIFVEGQEGGEDGIVPVAFPRDLGFLRYEIARAKARLVIIDPIMAYLGGDVDSHKDQDIRRPLSGLHRIAEETRCGMVLVRHLNKSHQQNAQYRGTGSVAIVGQARSCILMGNHPDDPEGRVQVNGKTRRVVGVYKSNLANKPSPREVLVRAEEGHPVAEVGLACDFSIFDVLSPKVRSKHLDADQLRVDKKRVAKNLRDFGPFRPPQLEARATQCGLSPKAYMAALHDMGWGDPVEDTYGDLCYQAQETYKGETDGDSEKQG